MTVATRPKRVHKTKLALLETVLELRKSQPYEDITVEQVLEKSGVSRGSLYHHFSDFFELIESAELTRFTKYVDVSIEQITQLVVAATSKSEIIAGVRQITRLTQSPEMRPIRADRLAALVRAEGNSRFRSKLAAEQDRLTSALAELVRTAQARGWFSDEVNPWQVAVFIQAYTLGRAVDEISHSETDIESWNALIDRVIEHAFMA